VRYVVALGILIVFAMILGFRVHTDPASFVAAFALMVAFGLCMCWISVLVGMLVTSTTAVQGLLIPIVMLFTFGSNLFAPASPMPGWLQAWVNINPVSKLVEATRGLLLGGPVAGPLLIGVVWMVGIVVVFFPLAVRAYGRRAG
jgi:oleandomycin transport system permease protein